VPVVSLMSTRALSLVGYKEMNRLSRFNSVCIPVKAVLPSESNKRSPYADSSPITPRFDPVRGSIGARARHQGTRQTEGEPARSRRSTATGRHHDPNSPRLFNQSSSNNERARCT
jgi:hypothetical protein